MNPNRKSRMGKIPPKYCGDVFLENLITASDKIKRGGWDEEYRKKYDRALIASLFLTGGRATEVLKLRKSSFDFNNKEATENGAFLVREFVLMKRGMRARAGKKKRRLHVTHAFPIWYDDPLVEYLLEWVEKIDGYLFPSRIKKGYPLSYYSLIDYVIKVGECWDSSLHITPEYFRRQRELHLAEKRGFTKSNIKAYINLKHQIHPIPSIRQEWQNLLVIAKDFQQKRSKSKSQNGYMKSMEKKEELGDADLFEHKMLSEARKMADFYVLYYSLENSARKLITDVLSEKYGIDWWEKKVPPRIQQNVQEIQKKERDTAMSVRSEDNLSYVNFGELIDIFNANWNDFAEILRSRKAVQDTLSNFSKVRNVVAHSCDLNNDEILRFKLLVKDWLRIQQE